MSVEYIFSIAGVFTVAHINKSVDGCLNMRECTAMKMGKSDDESYQIWRYQRSPYIQVRWDKTMDRYTHVLHTQSML